MSISLLRLVPSGRGVDGWEQGPAVGRRWAAGMLSDDDRLALAVAQAGAPTWAIERGDEAIGFCGLLASPARRVPAHISYSIAPSARRCGFATAAVGALLEALLELGVREVWAEVDRGPGEEPRSTPSARVLLHNGFTQISSYSQPRGESIESYHRVLRRPRNATHAPGDDAQGHVSEPAEGPG